MRDHILKPVSQVQIATNRPLKSLIQAHAPLLVYRGVLPPQRVDLRLELLDLLCLGVDHLEEGSE